MSDLAKKGITVALAVALSAALWMAAAAISETAPMQQVSAWTQMVVGNSAMSSASA